MSALHLTRNSGPEPEESLSEEMLCLILAGRPEGDSVEYPQMTAVLARIKREMEALEERKDSLAKWILWQETLDKIRPKGWTEYLMQIPVSPKNPNRLPPL